MSDQVAITNVSDNELVVATPNTTFPFLSLPAEIRNMIYKYLLQFAKPIEPDFQTLYRLREIARQENRKILDETLKVVRLCKHIYSEALPIYYSNTFRFRSIEIMDTFLLHVGNERRNMIVNISFEYTGMYRNEAFFRLGLCTSLKTLHVDIGEDMMSGSRIATRHDLRTATGMKQLLKVKGCTKVTVAYDFASMYDLIVGPKYFKTPSAESVQQLQELLSTELCKQRKTLRDAQAKLEGGATDLCDNSNTGSTNDKKTLRGVAKEKRQGKKGLAATLKTTKAGAENKKTLAMAAKSAK